MPPNKMLKQVTHVQIISSPKPTEKKLRNHHLIHHYPTHLRDHSEQDPGTAGGLESDLGGVVGLVRHDRGVPPLLVLGLVALLLRRDLLRRGERRDLGHGYRRQRVEGMERVVGVVGECHRRYRRIPMRCSRRRFHRLTRGIPLGVGGELLLRQDSRRRHPPGPKDDCNIRC